MSKIEEKIKNEANKFAEQEAEIGEIDRDALYKGFYHGAKWALSHQWVSVEDELPPNNEDVLVALVNGNYTFVGVAWCSKGSNGTKRWYSDDENLNMDFIRFWMPIPPLPEARKEGEV